jgi:hypothetical protein
MAIKSKTGPTPQEPTATVAPAPARRTGPGQLEAPQQQEAGKRRGLRVTSDLMMNSLPDQPGDQRVDEAEPQGDRRLPERGPGPTPGREPGNTWATPEAERPPQREEGTVSAPDSPSSLPGSSPGV